MADDFVNAAKRLHESLGEVRFVVPMASRQTKELFEAALHRNGAAELPLTLMFGHSHEALAAADVALVGSGTATLEAALFKTPMVITYRQSPVTWALMKRMLYLPWIGLPNILAREFLCDELVQEQATPEKLAAALLSLLQDTARQQRQRERFLAMHEELRQDTASKAADAVLRVMASQRA